MNTGNDAVKRQQGRRVLLLIAGIPLSIMFAATVLWWAVAEGQFDIVGAMGTANHGELIVPPKSLFRRGLFRMMALPTCSGRTYR